MFVWCTTSVAHAVQNAGLFTLGIIIAYANHAVDL